MRWVNGFTVTAAAFIVLVLYMLGVFDPSGTFRYRLTITVDVNGNRHQASSVLEARQRRSFCLINQFGGGCLPTFSVKGVAPMIRLPDGAVIFASLSGRVDYGRGLARLPWLLYVDDWRKATDTTQRNWPIIPLPAKTPRLEIPFEGHPLSKYHPVIWWVPAQELGPPKGYPLRKGGKLEINQRIIRPVRFSIEPTSEKVVDWLEPAPTWMSAYRGGPKISEEERLRRIRQIVRENDPHDAPARTRLETSKRML